MMQHATYHTVDDELLHLLLDAPSRWIVRNGFQPQSFNTLRSAVLSAAQYDQRRDFHGYIVKQPNDEVVVHADQIRRLYDYMSTDLLMETAINARYAEDRLYQRPLQ